MKHSYKGRRGICKISLENVLAKHKGGTGQDESANNQVLFCRYLKSSLFANWSTDVIYHCHISASKWYPEILECGTAIEDLTKIKKGIFLFMKSTQKTNLELTAALTCETTSRVPL